MGSIQNKWPWVLLPLMLLNLYLLGISTCKISDYEWNTYSSKADCMMKVLTEAENEGVKPDLEYIAKVEGYCKKYDR